MPEQIRLNLEPKPRVLFFDLETLRSAAEVGGWGQLHLMGMACGVVHDSADDAYHVYGEAEVQALVEHLRAGDLVVGFNHIRFDYGVLAAYTEVDLSSLPSFDILEDVERRIGRRIKLASLAGATLGETKSADGMQSLAWVKEGRLDLVREYCKRDVEVTKKLFDYGVRHGRIVYRDVNGEAVCLVVDWDEHAIVRAARKRPS